MGSFGEVENDVLFGLDDELFLASGGHQVLAYATGRRPIDPAIVSVFRSNLLARAKHAAEAAIPYVHVICPDKQSVMVAQFVTQTPVRLGEHYIRALSGTSVRTIYPISDLTDQTIRTFLKTDTHLTDYATILIAAKIAEELLQQDMAEHRKFLLSTLTEQKVHCGDLGQKLAGLPASTETFSASTWSRYYFHNGLSGGNNGGVDIVITPHAKFRGRLLWYGDSFGRELVRFMSFFFSEIMFLRTPFFHPEFIGLFRPDFLVTENVERYLGSCIDDDLRPLFHMFPFLSGNTIQPDKAFAEAFSAELSYPRKPYADFITKLGMPARPSETLDTSKTATQMSNASPSSPEKLLNSIDIPSEALLRAGQLKIKPNIHPDDLIYTFVSKKWGANVAGAVNNYFELGRYSAKLTRDLVDEVIRVKKFLNQEWLPARILDFASGYGCTSRHLDQFFPGSSIATCDIHTHAIEFNSSILGLRSYLSAAEPEAAILPESDIVVAMSFFSHMPRLTYGRWLRRLAASLAPGGVLIFTANSFVTDNKRTTGVTADEDGFGFEAKSEQTDLDTAQYGITLSYPKWVMKEIEAIPDLRLARYQEGLWWAIQDTYVCVKAT